MTAVVQSLPAQHPSHCQQRSDPLASLRGAKRRSNPRVKKPTQFHHTCECFNLKVRNDEATQSYSTIFVQYKYQNEKAIFLRLYMLHN